MSREGERAGAAQTARSGAPVALCRANGCGRPVILDPRAEAPEWPLCVACRAKKRAVEARWGGRR